MSEQQQQLSLRAVDTEPLKTFLLTGLLCLGISVMVVMFTGTPLWASALMSFSIGWSINLSFVLLGNVVVRWLNPYVAAIPLTALGMAFGLIISGMGIFGDPWYFFFGEYDTLVITTFFGVVGFAIFSTRGRLADAEARLAHAQAEQEKRERLLAETELRLLQAQIEPHFLFNTLSNIAGLIHRHPDVAEQTLLNLTTLLRSTLKRTREQHTTIAEELTIGQAYLDIQSTRMQGRISYQIDCPPGLQSHPLPPLLVQPLIENAVTHGIEPDESGGAITVAVSGTADTLTITVADTGHGVDAAESSPGTGLRNVRERLHALYGEAASLTLTENQPRGMVATLTLPLQQPAARTA